MPRTEKSKFHSGVWFNLLGTCTRCNKRWAVGTLMNTHNSQVAVLCSPCSKIEIAAIAKRFAQ